MDAFVRYDWPGNIRQLKNAIKRYLILSDLVPEAGFLWCNNCGSAITATSLRLLEDR